MIAAVNRELSGRSAQRALTRVDQDSAKKHSLPVLLGHIGIALIGKLKANHDGAIKSIDPEYLHQLRVAIRQLRVLLSLYGAIRPEQKCAEVAREAKWLAHKLGPARDGDVFVEEIWPPLRKRLGAGSTIDDLDNQWLAERRLAKRAVNLALRSRRYGTLMLKLEDFFADCMLPAIEFAGTADSFNQDTLGFARTQLRRRAKRLGNLERRRAAFDGASVHRLRIAVKKLRYAVVFFGPLYKSRRVNKIYKRLSRLQDILGKLNDLEVATGKVTIALKQQGGEQAERARRSLLAWRRTMLKVLRRRARSAWKDYDGTKAFW